MSCFCPYPRPKHGCPWMHDLFAITKIYTTGSVTAGLVDRPRTGRYDERFSRVNNLLAGTNGMRYRI